jgi:hypothetical protein
VFLLYERTVNLHISDKGPLTLVPGVDDAPFVI